ncbi:MAG: AAA family ATPase [Chitinophagales bacterium]|nr:AAA family ATPase [Saprospiraceae bacterium]MCB9019452.1 AAA family ATPase [Chitinophagales bacterium]MCB9312598.1 AAA family ATPase [Lewinellaceae bacterium]
MLSPDIAPTLYDRILEAHHANPDSMRNAIRDLRPLFEGIFLTLTEGEARAFSNVYSRTLFVIESNNLPEEMKELIHGFRKYANKVVHDPEFKVDQKGYFTCLSALAGIIFSFTGIKPPVQLTALYEHEKGLGFVKARKPVGETLDKVRCVVLESTDLLHTDDGVPFFRLRCMDTEGELGKFDLSLWHSEINDLSQLHRLVWPYCTLQIHTLRKRTDKPDSYTSIPATQVILEPDFLIDATDVANCFQKNGDNAYLYFLNKLDGSPSGLSAFKGNLVNDLLDRCIQDGLQDADTALREILAEKALQAARFGQDKIEDVFQSIKLEHLPNLISLARQLKPRLVRLEPTFVSADYGIQGRLDALIEDRKRKDYKDIFELKSGGHPNDDTVWINNQVQVVCYQLLLQSVFGRKRFGTSAVFYSAAKSQPMRNVASSPHFEARVQFVRNMVVRGIFDLAMGKTWLLGRMDPQKIGLIPSFSRDILVSLHAALTGASPLERTWYETFLAFVIRELITAKVGGPGEEERRGSGFAALWLEQREEKILRNAILDGLLLRSYDAETGFLELNYDPQLAHNFRDGDIGIIYRDNDLFLRPLEQQILKGRIFRLGRDSLTFSLNNRQVDEDTFRPGTRWAVEHDFQDSNYWNQVRSLSLFLKADRSRRELLFGLRRPEMVPVRELSETELDDKQKELLLAALAAKDYYLLQGPPGTGKTSAMLSNLVRETMARTDDRIVLLAFTNRAVNEICRKLADQAIPFLYLGSQDSDETESLRTWSASHTVGEVRAHIARHRIFITTASGFINRMDDLAAITSLDQVFVDEASQLTEPALAGLLTRFRKFVLIGDQNQLPAVVAQPEQTCTIPDGPLAEAGFQTLSESLFGRLYRTCRQNGWDHVIGMLETHFRMHEEVAELINPWYGGRLKSGRAEQRAPFTRFSAHSPDPWENRLSRGRALFIPTRVASNTSKTNKEEAQKVVELIKTLQRVYGPSFSSHTVGVVTPWRAQIQLIRSLITDDELRDMVLVDTVERFQGLEKKHIIASLAVYHPAQMHALQSVDPEGKVDRKLVVTLSRAEEQVILMGYEPVLQVSPFYRDLLGKLTKVE